MSAPFQIHYVETEEEKQAVQAFITPLYLPKYNTLPTLVHAYSFIKREEIALACMGVELASPDGSFQIERAYKIDRNGVPLLFDSTNTVQLNRWSSTDRKAGILAVLAAVTLAIRRERQYALVEHGDSIHEHCKRSLGIEFFEVAYSSIDPEEVPEENRVFYAGSSMKPYLVNLEQMRAALAKRTERLVFVGL